MSKLEIRYKPFSSLLLGQKRQCLNSANRVSPEDSRDVVNLMNFMLTPKTQREIAEEGSHTQETGSYLATNKYGTARQSIRRAEHLHRRVRFLRSSPRTPFAKYQNRTVLATAVNLDSDRHPGCSPFVAKNPCGSRVLLTCFPCSSYRSRKASSTASRTRLSK